MMNNKLMRQRFISGWLIGLNVAAMALLGLQLWTSALGSPASTVVDVNLDSRLAGGGFYWWTTIAQAFLLLTLVLSALGSWFSFRLSRRSEEARRFPAPRNTSVLPACASTVS